MAVGDPGGSGAPPLRRLQRSGVPVRLRKLTAIGRSRTYAGVDFRGASPRRSPTEAAYG
jgi:hypothetical protein